MRTDNKLWRNRKAKKELARQLQAENPGLEVVHAHAAGIDVGNGAHYAAVRPDRDSQPEKSYKRECQETYFTIGSVPILFCFGIQPNRRNVHS
jgi:hypothetical protein